jgi:MFS family permease
MMCMERSKVNYIVTAYMIAYGFAGLSLFALPDRLGYKKTMAIFGSIHLIAQFWIIFTPTYEARIIGYAVMGFCQLKNQVCYTWLYGLVMSRDKSNCSAIINAWDGIAMTIVTCYFLYWNKNWFPLFFGMSIAASFCHFLMILLAPESPKLLLSQGKVDQAIQSFNKIAKYNGSLKLIPSNA